MIGLTPSLSSSDPRWDRSTELMSAEKIMHTVVIIQSKIESCKESCGAWSRSRVPHINTGHRGCSASGKDACGIEAPSANQ